MLTSLYCLLAYMPYTYYALIKAPPYDWIPLFVHYHAALYWVALAAAAIAYWPGRKTAWYVALFVIQVFLGFYITMRPFMPALQNNGVAYAWSLIVLWQIGFVSATHFLHHETAAHDEHQSGSLLPYSGAVLVAITIALLYAIGSHIRSRVELLSWNLKLSDLELTCWSVISHVVVAIIIVTILNFIRMVSWKAARPRVLRDVLLAFLIFAALWTALLRFLENALSFQGWLAHAYAGSLAAALTLLGFSLVLPIRKARSFNLPPTPGRKLLVVAISVGLAIVAVALPLVIAGGDWNGILQTTFTLAFWLVLSVCFYGVRTRRRSYSAVTIVAVVLLTASAYKGLQASALFWAGPLGTTEDDIARRMEDYAAQDISFELAHHLLGNARVEPCGDLCRILREHTNIRDARVKNDLNLVDSLVPSRGERPNIFIFVIDSMRPDYLGAYNPQVDFTPNLDTFARESIVLRNVYTQYAGTTLSEPAIWSGAMLLHAHYLEPFSKVNSLEKMAKVDGYQLVVSYDTVLPHLLSPSDDVVKLDTDKLWNGYEVCSTIQQTESVLDSRPDKYRPVLFYAQPMNVHHFARNDLPMPSTKNWRDRPGFNNRIAYEVSGVDACMGRFISYLKARGLYDNSIVVLTSDHGDATGEFGRLSHSLWIFPEIMRVPLIVHLPKNMGDRFIYDDRRISTLTDLTPSLYYLVGHRPIVDNPLFGRPLFTETKEELEHYRRDEVFLASDARPVYGILAEKGRYLYTTYDSPADSFLFDLARDPNAQHSILTNVLKAQYDERIIEHLQNIADFYGYKPSVGLLLASGQRPGLPRGYMRVRTSDGFMHDIPAADLAAARHHDPGLTIVSH